MFLANGEIRHQWDALLPNSHRAGPAWTTPYWNRPQLLQERSLLIGLGYETACPAPSPHCAGKYAELANKGDVESVGQSIRLCLTLQRSRETLLRITLAAARYS
jgi:hypothetical protein